jgi:hypothetical protein
MNKYLGRIWCWLTGHKMYVVAFSRGGTITICTELRGCSRCGYKEGDDAEGLTWIGTLIYIDSVKDHLKYPDDFHFANTGEGKDETK